MRDERIRRLLLSVPAPEEVAAQRRAWQVVKAAYESRQPVRWPRRHARQLLVLAALAAVFAVVSAIVTAPGRALVDSLRDAIGRERVRGIRHAQPALFRLPASGRVLVNSTKGAWILRSSGSKRLLGAYADAAWSPHGLFVVAVRGHELVALTPRGAIRWTVARRGRPRLPSWSPSGRVTGDTRIAYVLGSTLRVVGGDSRGDRVLAAHVAAVRPAWRPGPRHVVAYVRGPRSVVVVDADTRKVLFTRRLDGLPGELAWSDDGKRLAVRTRTSVRVFDPGGKLVQHEPRSARSVVLAVAFAPGSHRLVEARLRGAQTTVAVAPSGRALFTGPGRISDLAWSPDGRWLLLGWRSADQWVLLPAAGGKVRAFGNVGGQFRSRPSGPFPDVAPNGWCC